MRKKLSLKQIILILMVCSGLIGILTVSYAFFVTSTTSKDYVIYTGNLKVDYAKKTSVINLEDTYPMSNQDGLQQTPHEFTVTNNGNIDARYQIRLEIDKNIKNMVPLEYIRISYAKNNGEYSKPVLLSDLSSSLVFVKNTSIEADGAKDSYGIKLWIDISAPNEIQGKEFKARIVVDSIQDVDDGYVVDTPPIITLKKDEKGNQDVHLKVGEEYHELGVEKVEDDQEIFTIDDVTTTIEYYNGTNQEVKEVQEIDTTQTGIYYINYHVTDESGNMGQATRIVTINQTDTIPDITLKGDQTLTLGEGDYYKEEGVEVKEENKVVTIGEVKTSLIGSYTVRYIVVDKEGNLNSTARTVQVIAPHREEILNGADPVLASNLIPVTIAENGTVTRASTLSDWYSYGNKQWANSVIVKNSYDTLNSYGKVHGATKKNGYVSLDGEDDYIDLGLAGYDFKDGITIAIRFQVNSIRNGENAIIGNWEGAGGGIWINPDKKIVAELYSEADHKYHQIIGPVVNTHQYYTAVYTYQNGHSAFYLDGKLIGTLAFNYDKNSPYKILLGTNTNTTNTSTNNTNSNIDVESVAIFNRGVEQKEVNQSFEKEIRIYNSDKLLVYEDFTNNEYANNEVIPEDSIESYFVWIPKYSYQLWDLGEYTGQTTIESKEKEISIKFGLNNTSDDREGECTTPMNSDKTQGLAGESGKCQEGDYMTHPAFISFNANGLWIGKFETGYDGAGSTTAAQVDKAESNKVIIKPNVYSWRNITVGHAFEASYNYQRELDSHMMKNTEWGAVAYLQHSQYGSSTSVRINNNGAFITGYAATEEPTVGLNNGQDINGNHVDSTELSKDGTYTIGYFSDNHEVNQSASTTGNKSGIYDMSGGAYEYVAGYATTGASNEQSELISSSYETKYYDVYESQNDTSYNQRILGDATGEMGPFENGLDPDQHTRYKSSWYKDYAYFVYSSYPWFYRSGFWNNGTNAGIFAFSNYNGGIVSVVSYRIVLAP